MYKTVKRLERENDELKQKLDTATKALEAKLEEFRSCNDMLRQKQTEAQNRCRGLEAKLEKAVDGLEFYSDDESLEDYGSQLDWDRVNQFGCEQDKGKRARQALKEIKGK